MCCNNLALWTRESPPNWVSFVVNVFYMQVCRGCFEVLRIFRAGREKLLRMTRGDLQQERVLPALEIVIHSY